MTTSGQPINPARLPTEDVADVLRAARQVEGMEGADGATVEHFPGGIMVRADGRHVTTTHSTDPNESFFAEIAPRGPGPNPNNDPFNAHDPDNPGAPDFADSRYWAREVVDMTGGTGTPYDDGVNFRRTDELNHQLFKDEIVEDRAQLPRMRWVPAINLSEVGVGGEGHAVPVGQIVRVFYTTTPSGRAYYWFTLGVGSATRFGVVRGTFDAAPASDILLVQGVVAKPVVPGNPLLEFEFARDANDDPIIGPVNVWPNLQSTHYDAFVYNGVAMLPRVQILPVIRIGGVWYVQQLPRWNIRRLPLSARITDCSLVSFVAGLFGKKQ